MAKRNSFTKEYYTGKKDQYDLDYAIFQKALWAADYGRMKAATVRQHIKETDTTAKVLHMHAQRPQALLCPEPPQGRDGLEEGADTPWARKYTTRRPIRTCLAVMYRARFMTFTVGSGA